MKRIILIFFLIFSMSSLARGTAQIADRIIIDGEEWSLLGCPLEALDSIPIIH